MLLVAGYFRLGDELPKPVWTYPVSYLSFYTYAIQVFLELIFVCVFHQIIKWILFVLDFANQLYMLFPIYMKNSLRGGG
jgi:hypothetical protein